jgi:hypothetical protein
VRSRLIATGLTVALLSGCGGETNSSITELDHADRAIDGSIAAQVGYIASGSQAAYEFQRLDLTNLQHVSSYTVKAAGTEHPVDLFTLDYPASEAKKAVKLYMTTQASAMNFAKHYKTINLPLSPQSPAGEKLYADLTITDDPTVLVAVPEHTFSTYIEVQHNQDGTSAASFTPEIDPKLKDTISITESSAKFVNGVATEGCQSVIRAELSDSNELEEKDPGFTRLAMQEVVCNSIGLLYSSAHLNYTYGQYVSYMKQQTNFQFKDGKYVAYFVFPEAAYEQAKKGEPLTKAEGVQAVK